MVIISVFLHYGPVERLLQVQLFGIVEDDHPELWQTEAEIAKFRLRLQLGMRRYGSFGVNFITAVS
jgi:hypothetical protein